MLSKSQVAAIRPKIVQFLEEDLAGIGDATSEAIFPLAAQASGVFRAKSSGILSGICLGEIVYEEVEQYQKNIFFDTVRPLPTQFRPVKTEGSRVAAGEIIAYAQGSAQVLLAAERVLLNLMQRMSGIATVTALAIELLGDPSIQLLDTRKTAPGLRIFDKLAVKAGGGTNHRFGLFDMVMIKDNHIDFAGSITSAVQKARAANPEYLLEVETRSAAEVTEAVNAGADVIMFDNQSPSQIKQLTKLVPAGIKTEASGGISLENIATFRGCGVDFLSSGFLTHSVSALDISFVNQPI